MSRELKPYPKYKDSGVEWIGEVPEEWGVIKYKRVFSFQNGHGFPNNLQGNKAGDIPFLKVSDIGNEHKYVSGAENYVNLSLVKKKRWNIVPKGSILTAKIGEALRKNHRKINTKLCLIDNNMMAIVPDKNLDVDYIYYLLRVVDFDWYSNPGAVPSLSNRQFREDYFMLPSIVTQNKISVFLDQKTSEIDALIADKEKLIALLEEKRQAVITETVTKGLNPNVKMKDSGIEWIGEIPEHWEKNKIKRLTHFITCGLASTPDYVEKGIPFLSAQNVTKSGYLDPTQHQKITEELHKKLTKNRKPKRGDILQVRVGAGIGQTCIVNVDFDFSIYVSLAHIRVTKEINNKFLNYILNSQGYRNYALLQTIQAGGVGNYNVKDMEQSIIAYPGLLEQIKIADYLDQMTLKVNTTINSLQSQISKLKQYRESLIYEAVTGKIDLRDYGEESELLVAERGEPYGN